MKQLIADIKTEDKKHFTVQPSILGAMNAILGRKAHAAILLYCIYIRTYKTESQDGIIERSLRKKLMNNRGNGDRRYICLTKQQWMVATGLSSRQYDKAIAYLKRSDPPAVDYVIQGTKSGGRRLLLTPNLSFLELIDEYTLQTRLSYKPSQTTGVDIVHHGEASKTKFGAGRVKHQHWEIQKKETINTEEGNYRLRLRREREQYTGEIRKNLRRNKSRKITDITLDESYISEGFNSTRELETFWRDHYHFQFKRRINPPWSDKERKNAREILHRCKDVELRIRLPYLIAEAIRKWDLFRDYTNDALGHELGDKPNIIDINLHLEDLTRFCIQNCRVANGLSP